MNEEKEVFALLKFLCKLPNVLAQLVVEYWRIFINPKPFQIHDFLDSHPRDLAITNNNYLSICDPKNTALAYLYPLPHCTNRVKFPQSHTYAIHVLPCDPLHLYVVNLSYIVELKFAGPKMEPDQTDSWALPRSDGTYRCFIRDPQSPQNWYLTMDYTHQIYLYTNRGKLSGSRYGFGTKSSAVGGFNQPCGLSLIGELLYVCDSMNHRVQVLNTKDNGRYHMHIGSEGSRDGHFLYPMAIAHAQEILYVGDEMSIQLFSSGNGHFIQRIGGRERGETENQFHCVSGIAIFENDRDRLVYVSDTYNARIKAFRIE